jgi:hypothetical protein
MIRQIVLRTSPSLVAEFQGNRDLAHASVDGLASLPTPLEPTRRLAANLRGPRLWVKREDATGLGFGGNKLRKLGYILHDAIASKADVLVSGGGVQSNSQRQVAAAAAKLGMECHLAVYQDRLIVWLPRRPSTGFREMRYSIDCSARIFMMCRGKEIAMQRLRNWEVGSGKNVVGLTSSRTAFQIHSARSPTHQQSWRSRSSRGHSAFALPSSYIAPVAREQAANIASNLPREVHCKVTQLSFETPVGRMICALLTLVGNLPKGFYCLCHLPLRLVVPSWGVCGMRKYNSGRIRTGLIPVCPDGDR